ncbi:MAG: halocyanin, partial [Anaerolineae bacterium]|nr:halocyanin [Anaerolineae bacterium]
MSMKLRVLFASLIVVLSACNNDEVALPTQLAFRAAESTATETLPPAPTATEPPTETPFPTDTPT